MTDPQCPVCAAPASLLYEKGGHQVHRCADCGLGFVADLPSPAELEAFYARGYYASDGGQTLGYSGYAALEPGLKRQYTRLIDSCLREQPELRVRRVLDVGCAHGFFLDVARERFPEAELVGLDVTPEAAELVPAKGYAFHRGFVEDIELPESHFDLVFMGDALEHVRDAAGVADRLARVLAPGGTLVLTTVDFGSWLARLLGRRWRLMKPPEHLYYWTRPALERLFGDRGLSTHLSGYWLYLPKSYVARQFREQFGFAPFFLALWPADEVPIWSFDVVAARFHKPRAI